MAKYELKPGEPIDKALKRFKRGLRQAGVLDDYKKHEFYEKPSDRKKKERKVAQRKTYLASIEE